MYWSTPQKSNQAKIHKLVGTEDDDSDDDDKTVVHSNLCYRVMNRELKTQ